MRSEYDLDLLLGTLRFVVDICDDLAIPYAVAGGLSVGFWAQPRSTFDVDLVLGVSRDQAGQIVARLGDSNRFPFDPNHFRFGTTSLIRVHRVVKRASKTEIIVIDLLLYDAAFSASVAAHRERHEVEDAGEFWFCSAEDLIVMKLIADRDQDQSDIRAIMQLRGPVLKLDYIEQWAKHFGKREVWEKRLSEWQAT